MKKFYVIILYIDYALCISFYGPIWSYDDESSWPGGICKKGGKRQSPIDIRTNTVIKDFDKQFIKHGGLKFIGYENVLLSGVNNGHTIQFSTEGDNDMHPTVTGGPLKYFYRLEQLHFHWLSEHSINGVKFPMEIHFVHVRSDLEVSEALNKRDGLAILSVFCNVQTELNEDQQKASEEIMQHIPMLLRTGRRVSGVLLNLSKLLSPKRNSYFTYLGSLTSPECNEVVVWIIFDHPIYTSDAQVHSGEESEYPLGELSPMLPQLINQEDKLPPSVIDLTRLFSPNMQSYYTYHGSLTTPQCQEVVTWIVMDTPLIISDTHYKLFSKVNVGGIDNYRSLQPVNRVIYRNSASLTFPSSLALIAALLNLSTTMSSIVSKGVCTFVNLKKWFWGNKLYDCSKTK